MTRTVHALVYTPAGIAAGWWRTVQIPAFNVRERSVEAVTLRIPLEDAAMRPPGLEWMGRVDIFATSDASAHGSVDADIYGAGVYGDGGVYGINIALSRLIYRGFIEDYAEHRAERAYDVWLAPYARQLDLIPLPAGLIVSGDVVAVAQSLVETYAPLFLWDRRNPITSGAVLPAGGLDLSRAWLGGALATLRDLAGANWFASCTPQGTVRFFQPALAGAATHDLIEGVTATNVLLSTVGTNRVKRVEVIYSAGAVQATATDAAAYPPRTARITATQITNVDVAAQLAAAQLASLDRMVFRGSCTVHPPYDIDAIEVGDTVALRIGRPLTGTIAADIYGAGVYGDGGVYGTTALYGSTPVVVAGITYGDTSVQLELGQPHPRAEDLAAGIARRVDTFIAQSA